MRYVRCSRTLLRLWIESEPSWCPFFCHERPLIEIVRQKSVSISFNLIELWGQHIALTTREDALHTPSIISRYSSRCSCLNLFGLLVVLYSIYYYWLFFLSSFWTQCWLLVYVFLHVYIKIMIIEANCCFCIVCISFIIAANKRQISCLSTPFNSIIVII